MMILIMTIERRMDGDSDGYINDYDSHDSDGD